MSASESVDRSSGAGRRFRLFRRVSRNVSFALFAIAVVLGGGTVLYRQFEGLDWVDSFENVAMIIAGMGPVDNPVTDEGKIFAGIFALFCGFLLVGLWGLVLAPFVQDVLRRFQARDGRD